MPKFILIVSFILIFFSAGHAFADDNAACVVKKDSNGGGIELPIHKNYLDKFLAVGFEQFECPADMAGGKKWGQRFCSPSKIHSPNSNTKFKAFFGLSRSDICSAVNAYTENQQ